MTKTKPPRFQIHTLGCKVNQYDSENLRTQLLRQGYVSAQNEPTDKLDLIVVNTWSVTSESDRKGRQMIRKLIRKHQPDATIVVGGHIANLPQLAKYADVDHIVRGDGIRWMRRYLGEDERKPIRHPVVRANIGTRIMGVNLKEHPGDACATLIPSVGCPIGCNFCSTSAMFGGKGKFIEYYRTGDELFEVMNQLASQLHVKAFFVMDENFLLDQKRALRLLELMEEHEKPWSLYVFSSANVLQKYSMEQLVALGVSWVWLGLEGKESQYTKLVGTDTVQFVKKLQDHGIRVLGSSIIGLETHTPENIDEAIEHAVSHNTEFHQFMLYTPIPGTALFAEHEANDSLKSLSEVSIADIHGQFVFNYRHPHIQDGQESEYLLRAFRRDFEVNGPSVVRIVRTVLHGWKKYKRHPNPRVRKRFAHEASNLPERYAGVLWATRRRFAHDPKRVREIDQLLNELQQEFGWRSKIAAPIAGRYLYSRLRRQEQWLKDGWTYEPPTFYETNCAGGGPVAANVEGVLPRGLQSSTSSMKTKVPS